jgi:hypothetical protein
MLEDKNIGFAVIIAHDYELNAEFARKFNDAVLTLKRVYLLRRAPTLETQVKIEESRNQLRQLLHPWFQPFRTKAKPGLPTKLKCQPMWLNAFTND